MKYQVLLCGENFELCWNGEVKNFGFVTTRWVKAGSIAEAELKAVALIKNDLSLSSMLIEQPTLTPNIYLEEIAIAPWWKRVGGQGYTFYEMTSESSVP